MRPLYQTFISTKLRVCSSSLVLTKLVPAYRNLISYEKIGLELTALNISKKLQSNYTEKFFF